MLSSGLPRLGSADFSPPLSSLSSSFSAVRRLLSFFYYRPSCLCDFGVPVGTCRCTCSFFLFSASECRCLFLFFSFRYGQRGGKRDSVKVVKPAILDRRTSPPPPPDSLTHRRTHAYRSRIRTPLFFCCYPTLLPCPPHTYMHSPSATAGVFRRFFDVIAENEVWGR